MPCPQGLLINSIRRIINKRRPTAILPKIFKTLLVLVVTFFKFSRELVYKFIVKYSIKEACDKVIEVIIDKLLLILLERLLQIVSALAVILIIF